MALDQNLFTLNLVRSPTDPYDIALVDTQGTEHYRKRRADTTHLFGIFEPLSESLLASVSTTSNSKMKLLELYNPTVNIELKYVGTLSFRWTFQWEDHIFEWKREECYLIRKPDPPVLVAITKEPPGRIRSSIVQIMDYNLNRFDIHDRKGLEIVMLTALLSFQDNSDELSVTPASSRQSSASSIPQRQTNVPPPPPLPPKEAPEDQIAILQAKEARDGNEIVVGEVGDVEGYARRCVDLLKDASILFIAIRSHSAAVVPKVVAVATQTKGIVYREDILPDVDELHQYVSYNEKADSTTDDSGGGGKKKKVIKLDDDDKDKQKSKDKDKEYRPPEDLTIRLSKIDMPELHPKAKKPLTSSKASIIAASGRPSSTGAVSSSTGKKTDASNRKPSPATAVGSSNTASLNPTRPSSSGANYPRRSSSPISPSSGKLAKPTKNSKPSPSTMQSQPQLRPPKSSDTKGNRPALNARPNSSYNPSHTPISPSSTPTGAQRPNPPNASPHPGPQFPTPALQASPAPLSLYPTWHPGSSAPVHPPPHPQQSQSAPPLNSVPSLGSMLGNAAITMLGNLTKR